MRKYLHPGTNALVSMLVSGVVARYASDLEPGQKVKSDFLWMTRDKEEKQYSSVEVSHS